MRHSFSAVAYVSCSVSNLPKLYCAVWLRTGADRIHALLPHSHLIIVAFASTVLLKLLRPEFSPFIPAHEEIQAHDLLTQVIRTLNSSTITIDDRYTAKLYADFFHGLLSCQSWTSLHPEQFLKILWDYCRATTY
ncbi:Transcription factor [Mycena sanguinolenta]|uniref:Transcription factor n=1 Tax=Mycena sanguinolenta TaxID=230812 RepID=A0A8H6Z8T4_9AGAR|nr:Transcription factor [Mycena sanguinolenta]